MGTTTGRIGFKAACCLMAAVMALAVGAAGCAAFTDQAHADTASITIRSYVMKDGYPFVNKGVGYRTDAGAEAYCYDMARQGPALQGQAYTDVRNGTPTSDYLLAKGYPNTTRIAGGQWSAAKALAITQLACWIASGTAAQVPDALSNIGADVIAAAKAFAAEAAAYRGGDPTIDGCSSICYVAGSPEVQAMLTSSLGARIHVAKSSADTAVTAGNRAYSLAGAVYGVFDGSGAKVAEITTGADGTGATAEKLKPGAYTVKELTAPAGFMVSDKASPTQVGRADVTVTDSEVPVTVSLTLVKQDAETGKAEAQGAATLDGAVYELSYAYAGQQKTVSGTTKDGKVVFTGIPLGKVTVRETKAPEGYVLDAKEHVLEVTAQQAGSGSAVLELTPAGEFTEQVKRGDLELVKVGAGDYGRLGNVPFTITSKTTGESHTVVTDANGYASTAADWNAHTASTNAGTAGAGVWFGTSAPDNDKGALIYDTYTVEEQRWEANEGLELIPSFDVTVYRDAVKIDLGTLTDPEGPKIGTVAADGDGGDHEAVADQQVTIVDSVTYAGLTPGKQYTLTGTLMDKATGTAAQAGGTDVVSETTFAPASPNGTQTVVFTFDGVALAGHDVVAFERLASEGAQVAVHADINDGGQTVKLVPMTPEIATTATDADDGDHETEADTTVAIDDEVAYSGLTPGTAYTLTGTLMDKATGEPVKADGKAVTSTATFTSDAPEGTVVVSFEFDGSALGGHEVVAFESLEQEGKEIAAHADIDDEGQTVKLTAPEAPAEEQPSAARDEVPKPGDGIPVMPLVVLAAGAAAVVAIARVRGRTGR